VGTDFEPGRLEVEHNRKASRVGVLENSRNGVQ